MNVPKMFLFSVFVDVFDHCFGDSGRGSCAPQCFSDVGIFGQHVVTIILVLYKGSYLRDKGIRVAFMLYELLEG